MKTFITFFIFYSLCFAQDFIVDLKTSELVSQNETQEPAKSCGPVAAYTFLKLLGEDLEHLPGERPELKINALIEMAKKDPSFTTQGPQFTNGIKIPDLLSLMQKNAPHLKLNLLHLIRLPDEKFQQFPQRIHSLFQESLSKKQPLILYLSHQVAKRRETDSVVKWREVNGHYIVVTKLEKVSTGSSFSLTYWDPSFNREFKAQIYEEKFRNFAAWTWMPTNDGQTYEWREKGMPIYVKEMKRDVYSPFLLLYSPELNLTTATTGDEQRQIVAITHAIVMSLLK